jgi:putative spermidine/putrescine transport system substrate-binding protein
MIAPRSADAQQTVTVVGYGGSYQAAQRKVYFEPFAKKHGVTVKEDEWTSGLAQLQTQVESGNVTWDVVCLGLFGIEKACDAGLVEPLDVSLLGGADRFFPGSVHECGIRAIFAGMDPIYNAEAFPKGEPSTLDDFFDVEKYPGKRGVRKRPQQNMEIALLADGVPPDKVYEVLATDAGVERALKKLDEIKPFIQWHKSPSEIYPQLISGEITMAFGTAARALAAAEESGKPLKTIWDGTIKTGDMWAIVKGSPNKDLALKLIQFINTHEVQKEWPKHYLYGPVLKSVIAETPDELGKHMPTHPDNQKRSLDISPVFWADYLSDYQLRFNAWLAK